MATIRAWPVHDLRNVGHELEVCHEALTAFDSLFVMNVRFGEQSIPLNIFFRLEQLCGMLND